MKRKIRFSIIIFMLFVTLTAQGAVAQETEPDYIGETGHNLVGEFYNFYYSNPNHREVYGNPITEQVTDANTGRQVQYFDFVRFEYYPENPIGSQVQLTPLGQRLYEHGTYVPGLNKDTPNCHQESHWDYPVCHSFYPFYLEMGGEEQLGQPVSGLEYLRGRLVQFFEFAQLMWMPENPLESEVVLAPLGYKFFFAYETDYGLLKPVENDNLIYREMIGEINVKAFPIHAVISNDETQLVNVIAKDQNGAPLVKASLYLTIKFPDGRVTQLNNITTDQLGLAQVAFTASSEELGPVEVIVRVTYNTTLQDMTITSFRLWY
jgi:hypothetical protein